MKVFRGGGGGHRRWRVEGGDVGAEGGPLVQEMEGAHIRALPRSGRAAAHTRGTQGNKAVSHGAVPH